MNRIQIFDDVKEACRAVIDIFTLPLPFPNATRPAWKKKGQMGTE
jgi:hypothetical protein